MQIEIIVSTSLTEKASVLKYASIKDNNFMTLDFGALLPLAVDVQNAPWELIEDQLYKMCGNVVSQHRAKNVRLLIRPSHFPVVSSYFRRQSNITVEILDATPADVLQPYTDDWNAHRDQVYSLLRRAQSSGLPYTFIPRSCHSNTFAGQSGNQKSSVSTSPIVVKAKDRFKNIPLN